MDKKSESRAQFLNVIKSLAIEKREVLEQGKRMYSLWERPDFIWHSLLAAFSTWGNSRGKDGLIENPDNYTKITFEALAGCSPSERLIVLERTLVDAKVRIPRKKAEYLVHNYDKILEMGGPSVAKARLNDAPNRQGKIEFLKAFDGIGDKYARDIMMDVYHPDFRDSIAIDTRIKNITERLGLNFNNYEEHEKFFAEIARDAGLNGWELDRLMYNYKNEIISQLTVKGSGRGQYESGCS